MNKSEETKSWKFIDFSFVSQLQVHHKVKPDQVEFVRRDYVANGSWETFLAYEDPNQVRYARAYVFARLWIARVRARSAFNGGSLFVRIRSRLN